MPDRPTIVPPDNEGIGDYLRRLNARKPPGWEVYVGPDHPLVTYDDLVREEHEVTVRRQALTVSFVVGLVVGVFLPLAVWALVGLSGP